MPSLRWAALAAAVVTAMGLLAPPVEPARAQARSSPPPCDCTHLPDLQAEFRNAMRLEHRFRAEAKRLRKISDASAAANAYARFLRRESRRDLESVPGVDVGAVNYVNAGSDLARQDLESALKANPVPNADLCARTDANARAMNAAISGAACRDIAETLRTYEDNEPARCAELGFVAHLARPKSQVATEEANAYALQVVRLRAAIIRVLNAANPRVEFDMRQTTAAGAGRTRLRVTQNGVARLGKAKAIASDLLQMHGQGRATATMQMGRGACSASNGRPIAYEWTTLLTTDGLKADVQFRRETLARRPVRLRCRSRSAGPILAQAPSPPGWVHLPLQAGASTPIPSRPSDGGADVSGNVTLHLCESETP